MTAKDEILGRIRTATGDGSAPPPPARDYRTADHPAVLDGEGLL